MITASSRCRHGAGYLKIRYTAGDVMAALIAKVLLVDGGLMEIPLDEADLSGLRSLQNRGVEGKSLVHQFLTDDWGPPPITIHVVGRDSAGETIDIVIPYD